VMELEKDKVKVFFDRVVEFELGFKLHILRWKLSRKSAV
jgi:hypothetical protein